VVHEIDVICLAGFMRILGADFVSGWQGRILNIHPSLLPKYQGLKTYQRALDAGDAEVGCSVHEVVPELDAGPILGQSWVAVLPDDTESSLAARVLVQEHQLYPRVLRDFLAQFPSQA
jgi:phosphoribosylglycinamide formyltransferase-1